MIQEEQATARLQSKALTLHRQLLDQSMFRLNESAKSDKLVLKSTMKALKHGIQIVAGETSS